MIWSLWNVLNNECRSRNRIETFYSAIEVNVAHGDIMHVVAVWTVELQNRLPVRAKALHVHLDASWYFQVCIRTGEEEACHSHLLDVD